MNRHERTSEPEQDRTAGGRVQPEWAAGAATARAAAWSSDRVLDPGDSHIKGELSLCVGEAA